MLYHGGWAEGLFPITPEAFCASLRPESLVLNGKEGNGRFRMELMLVCDPDYFAGHALEGVWRRTERYRPAAFSVRMP